VRQAVDRAQDEHVALAVRQPADVAEQRARLVAPGQLDRRVGLAARQRVELDRLAGAPAPEPQLVDARVLDEPQQPRAQCDRRDAAAQRPVDAQEDVLQDVVGIDPRAVEQPRGMAAQRRPVALEEDRQRLLVAGAEAGEEVAVLLAVVRCPGQGSSVARRRHGEDVAEFPAHLCCRAMGPSVRAARAAAYERARPEVLEHVPRTATRVLDLGCATGTTGAALKQRQHATVTGIEIEPEYAREAATRLDHVIEGDVETARPEGTFDALIAADVLEHLKDPWTALARYAQLLEPGGTAVVSLPNVGHWSTYANLARGSWPRKPEGIFDATHLRWFTLRDAESLLRQAGLEPTAVTRRGWILTRGSRLDVLAPALLRIPVARTLFCFQFIVGARRILPRDARN
jgi:2-polyprenyl-3-methyl-5-hydroxy-6-metoxy-1,4-benzoquinol methylase